MPTDAYGPYTSRSHGAVLSLSSASVALGKHQRYHKHQRQFRKRAVPRPRTKTALRKRKRRGDAKSLPDFVRKRRNHKEEVAAVEAAVVQRAPAAAAASALVGAVTQWDPRVADSMPGSSRKLASGTGTAWTQGLHLIRHMRRTGRNALPGPVDPQEWATWQCLWKACLPWSTRMACL